MDIFASGQPVKLGSAALEEILCRVSPTGAVGDLVPHALDAWSIEFPTLDVLLGAALSVALGLVAGIFPALQAMRLRVADALRRM